MAAPINHPYTELPHGIQPEHIRTSRIFNRDFILPLPMRTHFEALAIDSPMVRAVGPTSREGQRMHGRTLYSWGKTTGVFKPECVIICPYSTPEQAALVRRSGIFYDFTDIYRRLYEHNVNICVVIDWVKSIEIAFWLINLAGHIPQLLSPFASNPTQ